MKTTSFITLIRILLLTILLQPLFLLGQNKPWVFNGHFNVGCQVFLYGFFKQQGFPGLRAYAALGATGIKGDFIINYGPSLSVYTRTVGTNLNPLVGDWQIDFTNSFSVGALWGGKTSYPKFTRTFHSADYYNLMVNRFNAVHLGTNFTLNNHGRHQSTGSINLNFNDFSFYYYNDGGPPFDWIPLADKFDRYWTGGGGLIVHNKRGYNTVELGFDQFTGYQPLLYEVSNLLGIKVPLYDGAVGGEKGKKKPPNFNTGTYQLKLKFEPTMSIDVGVIGSLVSKDGKFWGVQDNIHMAIKNALHPNNDGTRLFLGGSFNHTRDVKF